MHRAIIPVGIGVGGGGIALRTLLHRWAWQRGTDLLVEQLGTELLDLGWEISGGIDWVSFYQLGAVYLVWEFRCELFTLARLLWHTFLLCITYLHLLIGYASWCIGWLVAQLGRVGEFWLHTLPRSERGVDLTCMAVVAAPGAAGPAQQPFPVGSFILVARPPVWDELWLAGYLQGSNDVLGRTTLADGSDWAWVVVKLVGLATKVPVINPAGGRQAPAGVAADAINWIYTPPACNHLWDPDAMEIVNLSAEATLILSNLNTSTAGVTVNVAGVGGDLVPLTLAPMAPMAPGGVGVGQGGVAAGLGLGSSAGGQQNVDLKSLEKAIQELQAMALSPDSRKDRRRKKEKKKKKTSRDRSDRKGRSRKKKKKRSSHTSSSSRSSRSRSRSSSSSASSSGKKKPLKWEERGRDQKVSYEDLCHVDQLRLKKRGDLLSFAAKNPGALTAHFLAGCFARLSKGTVTRSSQLRETSVTAWAHQHAGLSEPRDIKEVLTLAEILDHVNRKEISRALDILVQRIVAIQSARSKGGSWEKAEALELINTQRSMASSSMLALTNA